MIDLGRIGFLPKGVWDSTAEYEILDVVYYGNATYIATQESVNKTPGTGSNFWQFVCSNPLADTYVQRTDKATQSSLGIIKPDGVTLDTNNEGVLFGRRATESTLGVVSPDDSTIGVTYDGVVFIKAEYTRDLLNKIAAKADKISLDQSTSMLRLTSDGRIISEISLKAFKGDSYELTEHDKEEIADIVLGEYELSSDDIAAIAASYQLTDDDKQDIADRITLSQSDKAEIAANIELTDADKRNIAQIVVDTIGTADTTAF